VSVVLTEDDAEVSETEVPAFVPETDACVSVVSAEDVVEVVSVADVCVSVVSVEDVVDVLVVVGISVIEVPVLELSVTVAPLPLPDTEVSVEDDVPVEVVPKEESSDNVAAAARFSAVEVFELPVSEEVSVFEVAVAEVVGVEDDVDGVLSVLS
jgi:hypothetical protein